MAHLLAVDIGYSNLKALFGQVGSPPAALALPAGAGPATVMPQRLGRASGERHLLVECDGEPWVAGVEHGRLQNWARELHTDYVTTSAYRALLRAALLGSGHDTVDCLVTGLPVNQFQNPDRRENLRAALLGRHQVTAHRQVMVREVEIVAQPTGAYLDMMQDPAMVAEFETARTLVIDTGFFSVDWVLIDGGELRSASSGSSTNGMSVLFELVDELIYRDHGARLGLDQIEAALRQGVPSLRLHGALLELAPYVAVAARRTAREVLTSLKQAMRVERREVDVVLLTGGGAGSYEEAAREAYPRARIVMPLEPVLANVRGFWVHGSSWAEAASGPGEDGLSHQGHNGDCGANVSATRSLAAEQSGVTEHGAPLLQHEPDEVVSEVAGRPEVPTAVPQRMPANEPNAEFLPREPDEAVSEVASRPEAPPSVPQRMRANERDAEPSEVARFLASAFRPR